MGTRGLREGQAEKWESSKDTEMSHKIQERNTFQEVDEHIKSC